MRGEAEGASACGTTQTHLLGQQQQNVARVLLHQLHKFRDDLTALSVSGAGRLCVLLCGRGCEGAVCGGEDAVWCEAICSGNHGWACERKNNKTKTHQ